MRSDGRSKRTLVGVSLKKEGAVVKQGEPDGKERRVSSSRATEVGSVPELSGTAVTRSLWEGDGDENTTIWAIMRMASKEEKGQNEKTENGGSALGIRSALNVTESDEYAGELVSGTLARKRRIGIWEAQAMLREEPVSHDQDSHPVISFAQASTNERDLRKDRLFGKYGSCIGHTKGCARKVKLDGDMTIDCDCSRECV